MRNCSTKYTKSFFTIIVIDAFIWICVLAPCLFFAVYPLGRIPLISPMFWGISLMFTLIFGIPLTLVNYYTFFWFFGKSALHLRKFRIDTRGITIREFYGLEKYYPWPEISCIALCDCDSGIKKPWVFSKAIRLSIGDEQAGPIGDKNRKRFRSDVETWRQEDYMGRHFRNVILLEFSKELLEEVEKASGRKALDCRSQYGLEYADWGM